MFRKLVILRCIRPDKVSEISIYDLDAPFPHIAHILSEFSTKFLRCYCLRFVHNVRYIRCGELNSRTHWCVSATWLYSTTFQLSLLFVKEKVCSSDVVFACGRVVYKDAHIRMHI